MKPAHEITDRAKRYRANAKPPEGRKLCTFCASRENIDVDHIDGDESDSSLENLMYLCRPCNTRKGITQARNRIGVRTRQYNPHGATFEQFKKSAAVLLGLKAGDVGEATDRIKSTSPKKRAEYAERIEATNPFKSEAQRRKFFAMAARGEISQATLNKFLKGNPAAPTYRQYVHGVTIHQRGAFDEGGAIIHATPPELRSRYARQIAATKKARGRVPF